MIKYSNICTKMAFLLYYGDLRKPMKKKLLTAGTGEDRYWLYGRRGHRPI